MTTEITFPHCDPRVVHAPGTCQYCDESGLQPVRAAWGIAYTGHPDPNLIPCPGETARGLESLDSWSGNRARPSMDSVSEHLTEINAASELVQLMRQLSEEIYAAGWLIDWEFIVWRDLHGPENPDRLIDEDSRARLLELSKKAGGWVYMPDDIRIIDPQFICMADWLKWVEEH